MKIKFFQLNFEFDKQDAKIIIPLAMLALSLKFSSFDKDTQLILCLAYYVVYFYFEKLQSLVRSIKERSKLICPKCKSKKIILQGYQGYHSDEQHAFYLCTSCKTTSLLTEGGLTAS